MSTNLKIRGSAHSAYLPYADAFRACAIFFVFLGHVGWSAAPLAINHLTLADAVPFDGVAMLFSLSGFLPSAPYLSSYCFGRDEPLVGPYFLARFFRVYPLYFFGRFYSGVICERRLLCPSC